MNIILTLNKKKGLKLNSFFAFNCGKKIKNKLFNTAINFINTLILLEYYLNILISIIRLSINVKLS